MGKRRAYSDEFKARALAVVEMNSGNVAAATRDLMELYGEDVPESTVRAWTNDIGTSGLSSNVRTLKKDELVEALERLLMQAIGEAEKKASRASYQDVMRAVGILVDKRQLLTGQATDITETRKGRTIRIDWGDGNDD